MAGSWACLMYHATPARQEQADYFAVPASALAEQLSCLCRRGLAGRSLEASLAAPADGPGVAITFDDAHVSNHDVALPLLAEVGMTATVFVVPTWVGTAGYCSWSQLRRLHDAGWSVQSHTLTHPFLSTLGETAVRRELADSRRAIEDGIGAPVVTLALPNGDWPARPLRHLLPEAGYRYVATSAWHSNGDADRRRGVLGRYTVRRETTAASFDALVDTLPGRWSPEGLRLGVLTMVRGALGAHRYRAVRRYLIDRRGAAQRPDGVTHS